jgi:hypothetical protein
MAGREKVDLYKVHKEDYIAPKEPTFVNVKNAQYLAVSGRGAPGSLAYQSKIGALYGVAYTIKMTRKFEGREDYVVCKLEGQYWADDEPTDFSDIRPEELNWRLLIRTPDFIKKKDLKEAVGKLIDRGKGEGVDQVELVSIAEGKCVQMLHVGPYDKEQGTVQKMFKFAEAEGCAADGRHHEIYLSDPRRVAPEKLKTILRLPVKRN